MNNRSLNLLYRGYLYSIDNLKSIILYIQVSQQIPSTLTIRNIYITLLLIAGIISSIIVRTVTINFEMTLSNVLGPTVWTFIASIIILFSLIFILYVQLTIVFRIGHIIKHTPQFIQMIRTGDTQHSLVISTYLFVNTLAVALSFWVITRMLRVPSLTELYTITLLAGLILAVSLFVKYNQSFLELKSNIRRYPVWMISIFAFIILSIWILLPVGLAKLLVSYSEVLDRYNTQMRKVLILPMSDSNSVDGDDSNTFVFESSNDHSNTAPRKSGWVQTRSESNSNSILNTTESITSSTSEGTGIGTSRASASANLSQQNNGNSTRIISDLTPFSTRNSECK